MNTDTFIHNALTDAGLSFVFAYPTSTNGVYQAEAFGKASKQAKRFEAAGMLNVQAEQDWMGDLPYSLIRFELPLPTVAQLFAAIAQVAIVQRIERRAEYDEFQRRKEAIAISDDIALLRCEGFEELYATRFYIDLHCGRVQPSFGRIRLPRDYEHQFYLGANTSYGYTRQR